jgi:Flp pilus assembly protein protease CpaA
VIYAAAAAVLACVACVIDLRSRRIPNHITGVQR